MFSVFRGRSKPDSLENFEVYPCQVPFVFFFTTLFYFKSKPSFGFTRNYPYNCCNSSEAHKIKVVWSCVLAVPDPAVVFFLFLVMLYFCGCIRYSSTLSTIHHNPYHASGYLLARHKHLRFHQENMKKFGEKIP